MFQNAEGICFLFRSALSRFLAKRLYHFLLRALARECKPFKNCIHMPEIDSEVKNLSKLFERDRFYHCRILRKKLEKVPFSIPTTHGTVLNVTVRIFSGHFSLFDKGKEYLLAEKEPPRKVKVFLHILRKNVHSF
jgi:hypothetical protein